MNKASFIKRSEIDQTKWNNLVEIGQPSLGYLYTWYLDAICQNWHAIILGDYKAILALPTRKKYGLTYAYQPTFCQQLGIISYELLSNADCKLMLNKIPFRYFLIHIQIGNTSTLLNTKIKVRKNYILPLNKTYASLKISYSKDAIKNINKLPLLTYKETTDTSQVCILYKEMYGKMSNLKTDNYVTLQKACKEGIEKGKIISTHIFENTELVGACLLLISGNRLHHFFAAPTIHGKNIGVMHGYIDYIIKKYANSSYILDFEGSEIASVAFFYRKFNPQVENYAVLKIYRWLGIPFE